MTAHWTVPLIQYTIGNKNLFIRYCYSLPGLSFNSNATSRLKILQNSISAYKSNNNQPCTTSHLVEIVLSWQTSIKAIVYCSGNEKIRKKLFGTDIVIIDAKTKLISHRKQKAAFILTELKGMHLKVDLENKLSPTVRRNRTCLSKFKPKKKMEKSHQKRNGRKSKRREIKVKTLGICFCCEFKNLCWLGGLIETVKDNLYKDFWKN